MARGSAPLHTPRGELRFACSPSNPREGTALRLFLFEPLWAALCWPDCLENMFIGVGVLVGRVTRVWWVF